MTFFYLPLFPLGIIFSMCGLILAFYLEHNELEKIETELTGLRASIETEEYDQAVNELDKAVYLLKHVDEKNRLSWKNIF